MRLLVTGASSSLALGVLRRLLLDSDVEVWCGRHRKEIPLTDPRVQVVDLDLKSDLNRSLADLRFDCVIHFAGVTHASNEEEYWKVNVDGTSRLAEAVQRNGCRNFVYVSTRCATPGSGAYGESKLAAEEQLRKFDWESLLVLRPAEIYGGSSNEGIDRFISLARKFRLVPALFGHPNLQFAPLHVDDFSNIAADLIQQHQSGRRIESLCGPEDLTGVDLASRISRQYRALPIPVWWPALTLGLRALHKLGIDIVKPDQLLRSICEKTGTAETSSATHTTTRRFLAD
jgi:nucleoside-diphosphate-sugar epimerase